MQAYRLICAFSLLICAALGFSCNSQPKQELTPKEIIPHALTFKAEQKNLLFTFWDEENKTFATVETISEIPESAQKTVIVTNLDESPENRSAAKYVQVADLSKPQENNQFIASVASRYAFESKNNTDPAAEGSLEASHQVIMYSASWCGVCRKAKKILKQLNVPFEEKDIEASRSALVELTQKAQALGINPGGVPVIDVAGILLQGLDEPSLKRALVEKKFLKD